MARRRVPTLFLAIVLLLAPMAGTAAEGTIRLEDIPNIIRPGKTERISFSAGQAGNVTLSLEDAAGNTLGMVRDNLSLANAGANSLFWNGSLPGGDTLQPGEYILALRMGDAVDKQSVTIGQPSPQLSNLRLSDTVMTPGSSWSVSATANMAGELRMTIFDDSHQQHEILHERVPAGNLMIPWDGVVPGYKASAGTHTLSLTLIDEQGFESNPYHLLVTMQLPPEPTQVPTPSPSPVPTPQPERYKIPSAEDISRDQYGSSYWALPVGKWDEQAIWDVMMQPITVLVGRDQRETYKLRLTPDKSNARDNIVGEITYVSQGVHVLETLDNGWSLVETFNSSYGPNNRSRRGYGDTDALIRGYVETSVLETVTPRTEYGLLIDKLKQEMYVFENGKLLTTLIVSTGNPTRQQPWNETPSGEYLMVSRMGDFPAGNLTCGMGMRINGGTAIHEVPYLTNAVTGARDYSISERVLGEKASHGCIRVQRRNNEDGVNMTWVWNNIKVNTKVLVWDDTNRYHEYPEDDLMLYFNPDRGQYYHSNQRCPSIRDVFLPLKGSFTYAQLDDAEHQKYTPCKTCNPPERRGLIDEINRANGY